VSTEIDTKNFIEAVFALNKAQFGDARMELVPDEVPVAVETPAEPPVVEIPEVKPSPEDELPEWAKTERTQLRAEAANYRTRLREAETKLGEAKTPEEYEAAVTDLREQNAKLEKSILVNKVAGKHKLNAVLSDRLRGDTEEELEADAILLASTAAFVAPVPEALEGGLNPSEDPDGDMDPRELATRFRKHY